MSYPDLSFRSIIRNCARTILVRSLLMLAAIVLFTQGVNGYIFNSLSGETRIADMIQTAEITLIVAVPFVLYVVVLHARADLAIDHFKTLSRTDPLTGLLNRRAFLDLLKRKKRRNYNNPFDSDALLVIDLDHFKQINDRFGHDAGDAVLQQVADLFRSQLRSDDVIARFGGEEFAVALNRIQISETRKVAQRLRKAVEEHVFSYEGQDISLTASIGLARYARGQKLENALREADLATYQSKKDGRNRVSCAAGQFNIPAPA